MATTKERFAKRIAVRLAKASRDDDTKAWQALNAYWTNTSMDQKQRLAQAYRADNFAELGRLVMKGAEQAAIAAARTRADELLADDAMTLAELEEAFG